MSWQDISASEVDIDSPLTASLLEKIRGNTRALRAALFGVRFDATAVAASTWADLVTTEIYVPDLADYSGLQRKLTCEIDAKVDSPGDEIKLRLSGFGTTGGEVSVTSTSWGLVELSIDIGSSYKGDVQEVKIQGYAVTGSGDIRSLNLVAWRLEY